MKLLAPLAICAVASVATAQIPCFVSGPGTPLTLGDDNFSAPLPLGFTFNYAGVAYTDVQVGSNGYLDLGTTAPTFCDFSPTVTELTTDPEVRICGLWHDLDPTAGGTVSYQAVPASGSTPAYFVVTYDQVPFWGTPMLATFQIVLIDGGAIQISWDASANAAPGNWLVGCSEGTAAVANPVSFATLPVLTMGNPTMHDDSVTSGAFYLGGSTHSWTPDGSGGWIVTPVAQCAAKSTYGSGCVAQYASFYEFFSSATSFDLSNTAITGLNTGSGYLITSSSATFLPPSATATNLGLGDDAETTYTPSVPFPYPGGVVTTFTICSNGFISADGSNGTPYSPDPNGFLNFAFPTWSCWHDYTPTATGPNVWLEEVGGVLYVTWDAVESFGTTNPNTFQFQFELATGIFHIVWQTMDNIGTSPTGDEFLIGYTPAAGAADPGSVDLSVVAGGTSVVQTFASDILPLALSADANPVFGTTVNLVTDNIPTSAAFGGVLFGFARFDPGIDLTSFGMPGCVQHNDMLSVQLFFPSGATSASVPFNIPNMTSLTGTAVQVQSSVYDPVGMPTPLGAISSNGVELVLGS